MARGVKERRILDNVREDPCVHDAVAKEFFDRIAVVGDPPSPQEAHKQAYDVVRNDQDRFLCQGREVPDNILQTLFRVEDVDQLRYRIPARLDALGLRDAVLSGDIPNEDLRVLTDEYIGSVSLGNALGVVWASDFHDVEPLLDDVDELSDRLGRPTDSDATNCIVCAYNRDATEQSLHVPRALDAIDQSEFKVNTDCSADYGVTRPMNRPGDKGFRECVHRACVVTPELWELRAVG